MNVFTVTLEKMKDAVIAKLSSQCEELYVEVLKQFQKELLRPLWDKEWIPTVSICIGNPTPLICTAPPLSFSFSSWLELPSLATSLCFVVWQ
jgi:hypothetical protein